MKEIYVDYAATTPISESARNLFYIGRNQSHVLTAMGLTKEQAGSCIRISFSADHTEEDIDQICGILKQEVARARQ